ncbi:cytochrome o ubiquinol oxidase subunit IV [Stakelama marina]|uniref:Cytochrome bo(3) ubiquinol oxidase subunit 4 n=1 Tax=Stakelama marina TaxID=2826939 RepID=A0A8T4IEN5_9SPHN|nr:cytochrome o ubiquinol oxidase subunit IV [Stakelama marina]MBR0553013.1 cytochrome o ubiquinol oxidase subunit IV [Stakelama marina]
MSGPNAGKRHEITTYVIGYVAALVLTGAAFGAVHWHWFADTTTTLAVVFGLALVQIIVHFRFFLHISFSRSARDDLQLILFSTLIVALMVGGTIVILLNLRARMM